MATLQSAAQKWGRKTQGAGGRWQAGVSQAGAGSFCEGWSKFAGTSPAQCMQTMGSNWQQGVSAVGASGFDASIAGKEGAYIRGIQQAR